MTAGAEPMKITSPTLHATILFTITVFSAILAMSLVFRVEVVARGQGRVVPVSRVQVVQPEFPGRITAIHAHNGAAVRAGDALIEFDPTDAITGLGTIIAEQERLSIELARIEAFVSSLELDLNAPDFAERALAFFSVPPELAGHPFAAEQRTLLNAEINDLLASMARIDAREEASRRSEEITNARIMRIGSALEIQAERLHAAELLLQQGTASRASFRDVQQVFVELEREREVYLSELAHKIAERKALNSERRHIVADLRSSFLENSARIDSRLAALAEEERAARRRVSSAVLEAPASGIVDQLSVFTIGGIAEAGEELLRIVPTDVQVEIEGAFSNQDIGFMKVGQQANIRLDAYPSERFGFVQGEVYDIAADSTELTEGQWGYIVHVMPDQAFLEAGIERLPLRPGMTAGIDVTTDERRIISYFFAPIVRTIQDAMGER